MNTATGTFDVTLTPAEPELSGVVGRVELSKEFHGDLSGRGAGVMLACGDPQAGEAGYVAIETVEGLLHGRSGSFAFQQFGTMHAGAQTLHYQVVPGSGQAELAGITGILELTVDDDGTHHYSLEYEG